MCSVFSKRFSGILLVSAFLANLASADSAVVSTAMGHDTAEASLAAVRGAVLKNIKADQAYLHSVFGAEILPNVSRFVTSYKILDGSNAGIVNMEANVDIG